MSVFEDLIDELKNENLLEDTVIDLKGADAAAPAGSNEGPADNARRSLAQVEKAGEELLELDVPQLDVPQIERPSNEREFFRKRAMDEVSSLQMVEHVLSGVEREHMKTSSVSYDDLAAKKALHKFLQVSGDLRSPEHAETELVMRQETEAWSYALYERDQKISVANVRRFCEESRPVLSSQALIALARFYRNSPYSEDVRRKFDYVATRLFSRETGEETRRLLFPHNEMIVHINTLYANWSSIALYTHEDDQVEVSLTVTRFDEFTVEIENADSFDELLESDFFSRVRVYKEESAEMFYVPEVIASAIKCNLAIGNRYIELIGKERAHNSVEKIEEKYGFTYDVIVSEAAGKTLLLSDVLAIETGFFEAGPTVQPGAVKAPATTPAKPKASEKNGEGRSFEVFGVNKWLMVVAFVAILAGGGVYMWAEKIAGGSESSVTVAAPFEINDPDVKKYIRSPRSAAGTLIAMTEPSFESLSENEQKALMQKMLKLANEKNIAKVSLLNYKGRTVAFASKDRLELVGQ